MAKQAPAPNKPVATFRIGLVKASVWANGDKHFNTTFTRSYKDGDEWKDGDSFGHGDLLNLAQVAKRAEYVDGSESAIESDKRMANYTAQIHKYEETQKALQ